MPPVPPAIRRTALVRRVRGITRGRAAAALGGCAVALLAAACGGAAEPPPPPLLLFTDVTVGSGLSYIQHEFRDIPDCIFAGEPRGATGCLVERATGGAAAADYDGDGWIDLFVTRLDGPGLLFRNQGDGTFADVTEAAGLAAFPYPNNGAWWGDIDNDGDQDLFVTTIAAPRFLLFINDGAGSFREEAVERGAAVADAAARAGMSVAMGDFDRDRWL
ncbi:MAG: VCBS repeat-containing protein, partial [Chloroflexi bacterium]|nr:VCBS repeat-containing protein [Chloroflexota bacterium]